MVKPLQLYEKVRRAPGGVIPFHDFERLLTAFRFRHVRSRGSHRSYKHPTVDEILTIQPKGKEAQPYQVRKFLAMVREFDLKLDD